MTDQNDTTTPDLTLEQVATKTGVQLRTLQAMARRGALPGVYKLGKHWRLPADRLDALRNPASPPQ